MVDLKITNAALLAEMGDAFAMFAPYRDHAEGRPSSGRRARQAQRPAVRAGRPRCGFRPGRRLGGWWSPVPGPASCKPPWRVPVANASIGVSIRLPFEQAANPVIAGDEKYVSMKYFFTRKLMLVKESRGFICLPGGFGTLDETFELLTLTQTGKGMPVPIVFLDTPGDQYWETVHDVIEQPAREAWPGGGRTTRSSTS